MSEDRFYHSPRGVNVFSSINAAISALGGVPVELAADRFYHSPGSVKVVEALEELESLAGVASPPASSERFYTSPLAQAILERVNAVISELGGTPVELDPARFYRSPTGQQIVDALAELETSSQSGGVDLSELLLLPQADAGRNIIAGHYGNPLVSSSVVAVQRPNDATPYVAGDVFGDAVDARLHFPNVARVIGGIAEYRFGWWYSSATFISLALLFFDEQPETILGDNTPLALSDADADRIVGFTTFSGASGPAPAGGQNAFAVSTSNFVTRGSRDLWAYLVLVGGHNPTANQTLRLLQSLAPLS